MMLCPHCGFDLATAGPVSYGNIAIEYGGAVSFEGRELRLTRSLRDIVETLVRARGRGVTRGVLAERIEGDVTDATIIKYVERARNCFRDVDPAFDQIMSLRGFGAYKWEHRRPFAAA